MTLVAVNATNMFGPPVQLAALFAVLALVSCELRPNLRGSWLLIGYVGICLALALLSHGAHQAVIKGGKLMVFCLASALMIRGASADNRFPALLALRAFFGLCALNFLYAAATGNKIFRADFFIEFSIYSGYTIAILVHLARPRLTIVDRGLAWTFCLLCGSTMGLLLLILAEVVGRRLRPRTVIGFAVLAPFAFAALAMLMEARGKELTWTYLANSDRGRLITTYVENIVPSLSLQDWLFGVGVGEELHQFVTPDSVFNSYLARLGEGEVYAFCLHNEPLRLLSDFGLVGLVLVILRLSTQCSKSVLFLLGVCMITNSYLYSFSGALIASSLFNPRRAPDPSGVREENSLPEPAFQHA